MLCSCGSQIHFPSICSFPRSVALDCFMSLLDVAVFPKLPGRNTPCQGSAKMSSFPHLATCLSERDPAENGLSIQTGFSMYFDFRTQSVQMCLQLADLIFLIAVCFSLLRPHSSYICEVPWEDFKSKAKFCIYFCQRKKKKRQSWNSYSRLDLN